RRYAVAELIDLLFQFGKPVAALRNFRFYIIRAELSDLLFGMIITFFAENTSCFCNITELILVYPSGYRIHLFHTNFSCCFNILLTISSLRMKPDPRKYNFLSTYDNYLATSLLPSAGVPFCSGK